MRNVTVARVGERSVSRRMTGILAAATALAVSGSALAVSNWTTATSGNWSTGPWDVAPTNTAGDVVQFGISPTLDFTGQTVTVDGAYTVGTINAADSTTGGGGIILAGGTLTLDNGAAKPVISTTNNLTEPGGTTPFNNPLRITSVLAGSNGFEKTGPGYLSLEATNTFTGNVKLTAPAAGGGNFLRLTADDNLGDAGNDIDVAANAQAVGLYSSTGITVTLNSGRNINTSSASGTQDFWIKTKGTGNIIVDGVISGATRFRKNDSGIATLRGANTFTGGTLIEGGTLVLSGGSNRLPSGSAVQMGNASTATTLQIDGGTQTLNALTLTAPTSAVSQTIKGTGTLSLLGTGDYTIGASISATSLDMSGLNSFTFSRTANALQVTATGASVTNTINLAKTSTNTISATAVRFGGGGTNNSAGQLSVVNLGQSNVFNIGTELLVGYFQGNGTVAFQSGLTAPTLTVRGAAGGTSAAPLVRVGQTNSGALATTGILNLTGGSADIIATAFDVAAQNTAAASTNATGTFTMPGGTVVADALTIARRTGTGVTAGTPTLDGTINQSGGTVTAAVVYFGSNEFATSTPTLKANYNLSGGSLLAGTIDGNGTTYNASSVRNLTISNNAVVRNLNSTTDLVVDGVDATAGGRLNVVVGTGGATFIADAGRSITVTSFAPITGAGNAVTKSGLGTLFLNNTTTVGSLLVSAGTLGGSGTIATTSGLTVDVNGAVSPGNSIGTLTVTGNLSVNGTYTAEVAVGSSADLLAVSGALNLGASSSLVLSGTVSPSETYVLATYGAMTTGNFFSSITNPFAATHSIVYGAQGGLPGQITLAPIPEPGSAVVSVGGMILVSLRRRR